MFQKIDNFHGMPKCKCTDDKFNVVVDQFDAQDFNLNEAGHIRNSISELARAQSKSEYDSIMARLVELQNDSGIKEGTTIEQAISQIKPRWAQSPNEIEQYLQMTNGDVMKRIDDAYQKVVKEDVKDTPVETPPAE